MKKLRKDNKGFTLVELIVVLVILAILAAILVPALLGYIDEAKASQLELHGKSVLTAAQAAASKAYASKDNLIQTADNATNKAQGNFIASVRKVSEMASFAKSSAAADTAKVIAKIYFKGTDSSKHDYWTVDEIYYTEDGGDSAVHLYNGVWETVVYGTGENWAGLKAKSGAVASEIVISGS